MQHLVLYSEIVALGAGVLAWKYLQPHYLRLLVVLLLLIVGTESSALLMKQLQSTKAFVPQLYNIMLPLQFSLYCYIFLRGMQHVVWKNLLRLLSIAFLALVIVVLWRQAAPEFSTLNYAAGSIMLSIYSLRYIYEQLSGDAATAFWDNLLFYMASGLLVFYVGTLPFHAMRNYLFDHYPRIFDTYSIVFKILACGMYLLFAWGFFKTTNKKVAPSS